MDIKGILTHPLFLAGLAGGAGYYFGPRFNKENGRLIGTGVGVLGGYLASRLLAPKVAAAPAQLPAQGGGATQSQTSAEEEVLSDYVDIDAYGDEPWNTQPAPRPAPRPQQAPQAQARQAGAQAASRTPVIDDLSDLSEGWGESLGTFSGALGGGTSDRELDDMIAAAEAAQKRGN